MNPIISSDTFNSFFAWAPLVVGVAIYLVLYVSKRRELATSKASGMQTSGAQTFACAQCGRRGPRDQMVPQDHGGAVGYKCSNCAREALA
jgi:DNA-directed RNA polymerase subunit RPC12/RpoP